MSKIKEKASSNAIGEYVVKRNLFQDLDKIFLEFSADAFAKKKLRERFHRVNEILLDLIQKAPERSYLLPAVIDFIERVNKKKILHDAYHISLFEFWLNQFSGLNEEENYRIRGK